jgi:hypothetical protein
MNATRKLDLYLESFNQRLRSLRLLQGSAVLALVLLVVGGIGAWFSAESGFASTTTNAFRILLVLALVHECQPRRLTAHAEVQTRLRGRREKVREEQRRDEGRAEGRRISERLGRAARGRGGS